MIFLVFIPSVSWAKSTICTLEKSMVTMSAVAWDHETGKATITDQFNGTHEGVVILTRDHGSNGKKVNIYI